MIIDAHVHIWQRPVEAYYRVPGVQIPETWQRDRLLAYMEELGVSRAIVVASESGGNEGNNEFVAGLVRDDPGHFAGLAAVDPRQPGAIDILKTVRNEYQLQGVSHYLWPPDDGAWLMDADLEGFWGEVQRLGLLVSLNVSHLQADSVGHFARRFDRIPILLCHMGRPDLNEPVDDAQYARILALADCPNVYVKVSGFYAFSPRGWDYPNHDLLRYVRMLAPAFGSGRMLWGSDFPPVLQTMTYRQSLEIIRSHCPFLSDDQRADILGRTAAGLLG